MADSSTQGGVGLPSAHIVQAALHVATIVDQGGSPTLDAAESYWHHATGGTFAPADLDRGQHFLLSLGLLAELNGKLTPTAELAQLLEGSAQDAVAALCQRALAFVPPAELEAPGVAAQLAQLVPDAALREELLLALARRFDDLQRRVIGEIGEEVVMFEARAELLGMGRSDLARDVRRVSMISDQLGYDVNAPRITGPPRLLEVKATTSKAIHNSVTIHLSRNEADTGARFPNWALVVCVVDNVDQRLGRIAGCCAATVLWDLLPHDGVVGRWDQASIEIPLERLLPGLPGVVG
jgi:hypothetical protein